MDEKCANVLGDEQDPVHFAEGAWWFWDETWADKRGPYETEEDARAEIHRYVAEVLGW